MFPPTLESLIDPKIIMPRYAKWAEIEWIRAERIKGLNRIITDIIEP